MDDIRLYALHTFTQRKTLLHSITKLTIKVHKHTFAPFKNYRHIRECPTPNSCLSCHNRHLPCTAHLYPYSPAPKLTMSRNTNTSPLKRFKSTIPMSGIRPKRLSIASSLVKRSSMMMIGESGGGGSGDEVNKLCGTIRSIR